MKQNRSTFKNFVIISLDFFIIPIFVIYHDYFIVLESVENCMKSIDNDGIRYKHREG